ncbi:MAG: ATP-binding cassette domain-containing protein [Haloarculaceae archaeon]
MSTVDTDDSAETDADAQSDGREPDEDTIIRVEDLSKRYEGVQALDNVTLNIEDNEVLALVGDNGAGKSTLIKSLAGVINPTGGSISVRDNGKLREVVFEDPNDARQVGIETVFQDLGLSGQHDVASNVFMGREPTEEGTLKQIFGHVDREQMEEGAVEGLERIGFQVDPKAPTEELSGGQQQAIAVARALVSDPEIVLLDEPTAEVSVEGSQKILEIIESLQEEDHTVVFISHNLQEVFEVADRIAVLRDGELVDVLENDGSYDREHVVSLMTGAIAGTQSRVAQEQAAEAEEAE